MGIPRLFPYMQTMFPEHIHKIKNRDFSNIEPVDNFMIDLNGIFHGSAQKIYEYGAYAPLPRLLGPRKPQQITPQKQLECFKDICLTIDTLVNMVKPKKRLILCIDGVAPRSKACIAKGTLISMANGTSIPIETIKEGEFVLGWNGKGFTATKNKGLQQKGEKDVIKLTLYDSRELVCTPDHKILVTNKNGINWTDAGKIQIGDNSISGLEMPADTFDEKEDCWQLNLGLYVFSMNKPKERAKTLAFSRILGYILADGYITSTDKTKISGVSLGTRIDSKFFNDDIYILTGKRPTVYKCAGDKGTVFTIHLPAELTRLLLKIPNIPVGKRICQPLNMPKFLLQENCPKSIIREFLGGLFGGDGCAPYLRNCKNGNGSLGSVRLTQSIIEKFEPEFKLYLKDLCFLLTKMRVDSVIKGPYPHTYKDDKMIPADVVENPRVKYEINTPMDCSFAKNIGFRYAINKNLRLTIASAYWNQCKTIKIGRDAVVKRAIEIFDNYKPIYECRNCLSTFSCRKNMTRHMSSRCRIKYDTNYPVTHCNLDIALNEARQEYKTSNVILHDKVLSCTQEVNYIKTRGFPHTTRRIRHSIDAYEFLTKTNTLHWFTSDDIVTYAMPQDAKEIPNWSNPVINICSQGKTEVFDIEVYKNHSFLANGLCVHNCQQRSRRFRGSLERKVNDAGFDSCNITTGTKWMDGLSKHIDAHIQNNMNTVWRDLEVIYSDCSVAGEGEHKIFSYVRKYGNRAETFCIHGADADLIMLALATHFPRFHILRDDMFNSSEYYVISIEKIRGEMADMLRWEGDFDPITAINDFILMCFMVGNDFLPHIPGIEIIQGGIDTMIDVYKQTCAEYGHLTDECCLAKKSLKVFLGTISQYEKGMFTEKLGSLGYFPDPLLQANAKQNGDGTFNVKAYRKQYYKTHFPDIKKKKICHDYLEGIQWVLSYYTKGVPNWKWSFPYHYAPFTYTLAKYTHSFELPSYEPTTATLPFIQLLSVLPPKSAGLLPSPLDRLLTDEKSPLKEFCPEKFEVDLSGKKQAWEGIVILPMVEYDLVEKEYFKVCKQIDHDEFKRNVCGKSVVYRVRGSDSDDTRTSVRGMTGSIKKRSIEL